MYDVASQDNWELFIALMSCNNDVKAISLMTLILDRRAVKYV